MDAQEGQIMRMVLRRMHRCRVCHHAFSEDNVRIISKDRDMWMMLVECTDCRAKNFVAAVLNEGDPAQAEAALKRLSEQQGNGLIVAREAPAATPDTDLVSSEDVLDMHDFLEDFSGDFEKLFR